MPYSFDWLTLFVLIRLILHKKGFQKAVMWTCLLVTSQLLRSCHCDIFLVIYQVAIFVQNRQNGSNNLCSTERLYGRDGEHV